MDENIVNDVNDAINTGISGETVKSTIEDMEKKEGKTPEQFKDAVEIVAEMKSDKPDAFNPEYASELVQNNSNRIKAALNEGIEPQEISMEMTRNQKNMDTVEGRKKLNFITRLISKMKRKERKKQLQQQQIQNQQDMGGMQKVYTYTNNNQNNG